MKAAAGRNKRRSSRAVVSLRQCETLPRLTSTAIAQGNRYFSGSPCLLIGTGPESVPVLLQRAMAPSGAVAELSAGTSTVLVDAGAASAETVTGLPWRHYEEAGSRQLAWMLAAGEVHALIERILGTAIEIQALHDTVPESEHQWFRLELEHSDRRGAAPFLVALAPEQLDRLACRERGDSASQRKRQHHWLALPTPLRVLLPGPDLAPGVLHELEPGDVVVLTCQARSGELAGRLVQAGRNPPAGRCWSVRFQDDHHGTVNSVATPYPDHQREEPIEMNESASAAVDQAAPSGEEHATTERSTHPVDHVPVRVEFDLGQLTLPLADLARLEPGYVFELPQTLERAQVRVLLNGTAVGTGELVAVGEILGVRLTAWNHGPDND